MGCFALGFWEQVCIMIVVIMGVWALIQLLLPYVTQFLPAFVIGVIRIILWVIMAIIVIKLIFDLLGCLLGSDGFHLLH